MTTAASVEQPPGMKERAAEHMKRLACPGAAELASCTTVSDCSPQSSADSVLQSVPQKRKASATRLAREDLLASKFRRVSSTSSLPHASPGLGGSGGSGQVQDSSRRYQAEAGSRPPVTVPACGAGARQGCAPGGWCSCDISIPPMDWAAALHPVTGDDGIAVDSTGLYHLPGGITVRIVTRPDQVLPALKLLRQSMADSCVAIDLEWRPDGFGGHSSSATSAGTRVALMQLASATVCVLVRTCRLPTLPPALEEFLGDPSITLVGYSWDGADQAKLSATYGFGRERFAAYHDLQQVSQQLGYHGYGLGALAQQVLGFELPKSRKVTMSNWEAWQLSSQQIQYAALDAIVTGHVYRGLRLWHASPAPCASCRQVVGMVLEKPTWECHTCHRGFETLSAAQCHVRSKQHAPSWQQCAECGRLAAAAAAV